MDAKRSTTRKFDAFNFQGHLDAKAAINYLDFFVRLAKLDPAERYFELGEKAVAIQTVRRLRQSQRFAVVAYEGPIGVTPVIYDRRSGATREPELTRSEFVATRTHAVIDTELRKAVIEFNLRGAKQHDFSLAFEELARKQFKVANPSWRFTPVLRKDFLPEIRRMERIRVVEVQLAKPNIGWTDNYDYLSQLAEQSNGGSTSVKMTANRGDTIPSNKGIMKIVTDELSKAHSSLDAAKITGRRPGETADATISSEKFTESFRTTLPLDADNEVQSEAAMETAAKFLDKL